jgi:hypothetical protein
MNLKKMNKTAIASFMLLSTSVFALPTIYPTTEVQSSIFKIKNETDSNLVADTVNPRKVYVMPPNSSKAYVSKNLFLRTANLGFCGEMKDLQSYSRNAAQDIADYQKRANQKKKELDGISTKLSQARQDAAEFAATNNLRELMDIDTRMTTLDELIKDKNEQLKNCNKECDILKEEIYANMSEQKTLISSRQSIARGNSKSVQKYDRLKASVEGFEQDLDFASKSWNKLNEDLISIKSTFFKLYKDLGSLEGARAKFSYQSEWDNNILTLRNRNPNYEFSKIQTENAVFITDLVDLSNIPGTSAILGYQLSTCVKTDGKGCMANSYPETISGTVVLSTIGACPIEHPDYFDLNPQSPNTPNEMTYGLTVAYEYPTAMNVTAKATYNMHKMYEKIVSSGRSGGFFSSRSWTSVSERTAFSDSFKVDWSEQDAKVAIPEAKKLLIEQEMRNGIFARLAKIGLPQVANPGELVINSLPKSGALVLAEELKSNTACQTNYYCTGASILLNVLDSIFGNSQATASYQNIQDADLTDRWSSESVVMKPYITTYLKKDEE